MPTSQPADTEDIMPKNADKKEGLEILRLIQYAFPMVFIVLAFGFYFNGQVPAIIAWVFAAVGVLEYFLIGIIRIYANPSSKRVLNEV